MTRHTFAVKIHENQIQNFRSSLGQLWSTLTTVLDQNNITNFSIWSCDRIVFGYGEINSDSAALSSPADCWNMIEQLLQAHLGHTFTWISSPGHEMRLMYENYGIVRSNKELIRHRVFMTHLKPNCAEEYKRRHDHLAALRNNQPDPGPDSNFTIWNAGNYIFGYDEIDTTMELDETPESLADSAAWETKQLEIMDWISNDVDWLTHEFHPACVRIAWHF